MKHSYTLTIASLGLTGLLTGCDGGTITYTPNSQDNSSATSSVASFSSTISSTISSDYEFSSYGDLSSANIISSHTAWSSSLAVESSSSTSSQDPCDIGTAGAPACYAITPNKEQCAMGNCEVQYTTADYCGVKGLDAELLFYGYEPERCQAPQPDICGTINGRTYFSNTLEEGGLSENGPTQMHWQASFNDGQLSLLQSDFIISGTYQCQNNQVITTFDNGSGSREVVLVLDEKLTQFELDTLGNHPVTYTYSDTTDSNSCDFVAGNLYSTPPSNSDNLLDGPTILDFKSDSNLVTYGYSDIRERGFYDCDLGQLHVHLDSKDEPLLLEVNRHAVDVTILGEHPITLDLVEDTVACTAQYAPVCAAQTVQCLTAPCYPIHTTYSNQCVADAAKSHTLFEGECGDKEGDVFAPTPTICPANVDPVCAKAKTDIQCITAPCHNSEYLTYNNACEATANKAQFSFNGSCTDIGLEQTVSFEQQPTRLYNVNSAVTSPAAMPANSGVTVINATIRDDILIAKLGYSGCDTQPIFFNVDASILLESYPEQIGYTFSKKDEDLCEAYFEATYEYDLLPVRANFNNQVEGEAGLIVAGQLYKR